jgi:O-antigen/teichoic acid export membrane protein
VPGRAVRAIGWRAAQQAGVQAIYFLRLLVLAYLLAPESFGQLAIAMLVVTTCLSLSELGMVEALVQREQSDRDERDAAWTVGVLRATAIAVVLGLAAPIIASFFGNPGTAPIIAALALRPLLVALGSIGVVELRRRLRFRDIALIQVPGAATDACVAIALASSLGVWALVTGSLAGALASTILSYVMAPHVPRFVFRLGTTLPLIRFGRWVLGTSVVGLIASAGVQFVVSRRLGIADLGLYFLAAKVAFMPADAASAVLAAVAFPLYSSIQSDHARTREALRASLRMLALVLFPTYAIMIALAPSLAETLGPRWAGTGPLIQLIGVAAAMGVYADAALPLLMGRGRPDRAAMVVATQTVVLLALLVPLISTLGVTGAAVAWLPAYASAQIASVLLVRSTIGQVLAGAGPQLFSVLALSAAVGIATASVRLWLSGPAAIIAGGVLGILVGGVLLKIFVHRADLDVRSWFSPAIGETAA